MGRKTQTIADQVYGTVKSSIMKLQIAPGTAMSEKEISERLNVSRTPVREAFIRMEKEGLVRIYPQRGTYVSRISIDRAKEERFLRESLEIAVLREFCQEHSEMALIKMRRILEDQEQALKDQAYDKFMDDDDDFHNMLYEETNKKLCADVIKNSNVDYYRLRCLSVIVSGGIAKLNLDQHRELVNLICEKNVEGACQLLTKHLRKLFQELDGIEREYPDYFRDPAGPNMAGLMLPMSARG